jgi:hypothetical protein
MSVVKIGRHPAEALTKLWGSTAIFCHIASMCLAIGEIPLSYAEHWAALATQIKSLQRAGELYGIFQSYHTEDTHSAGTFLREQCGALVQSLEQFRHDFADSLPSAADSPD